MRPDDQPRPDLDAAVDAVAAALTAVDDDAVATSLRRTRSALADATPARGGWSAWRWAVPVAALVLAALAARAWWPPAVDDPPRIAVNERPRPAAPPIPPSPDGRPAIATRSATQAVEPRRLARSRVAATSAPVTAESPRRDPLEALVAAVQAIPADAWRAGVARASAPLAAAEMAVPPIHVSPIATPPLGDLPAEPFVPGEP